MRYLVDTNVISEVGRGERCNPHVAAWYGAVDPDILSLSVLVIGEIRDGIERLRPRDPGRARLLERWLLLVADLYADRTIAIDRRIADRWGRLNAGVRLPTADGLMAATALVHRLVVVSRNVRDFTAAGVQVLNPFEPSS